MKPLVSLQPSDSSSMIIYLSDKRGFQADVLSNRIEDIVHEAYKKILGKSVSASEVASWRNSLVCISLVLADPEIPDNSGVAVEYMVPSSPKRIDVMITGLNVSRQKTAVIVELKQWSEVSVTAKDGVIETFLAGARRELLHPSYQAWSYSVLLEDYSEVVRSAPIRLHPCAYLHNCEEERNIRHSRYKDYLDKAPAFLKADAEKLRAFLRKHVRYGDRGECIYEITRGIIRPSKSLADCLSSMLEGNHEFVLIDNQKLVFETALDLAQKAAEGAKQTLIVKGGPGTGKSVVAVNLLVELTRREKLAKYITKNAAPRAVYEYKLKGDGKKSRISNLFGSSGEYHRSRINEYDILVVDEAHRLNEKSGIFSHLGENQIKELIHASRLSIFFIDDAQRVTMKDIGESGVIREWARKAGSEVVEMELESQFRCNGSDGYLAWVDSLLEIRETANPTLDGISYEVTVCDFATELRDRIRKSNSPSNKARMVAGYCWEWVSKKDKAATDIVLDEGDFRAQWNFTDGSIPWLVQPDSVEQVGCIHTCQGLELDYIGVIFGPDLVIRNGIWTEFPNRRARSDLSIKGYKKLSAANPELAARRVREVIRNTYRTLLTRAQRGCYIYSVDPETNLFLRSRAKRKDYPDQGDSPLAFAAEPLA